MKFQIARTPNYKKAPEQINLEDPIPKSNGVETLSYVAQYTYFSDLFRVFTKGDSVLSSQRAQRHASSAAAGKYSILSILRLNLIIEASAGMDSGIKQGNPLVSMMPLFLNSPAMIRIFRVLLASLSCARRE